MDQRNDILAAGVVDTDHRLETARDRTQEELARHRWHWTLDESNPGRVSLREYARAVGRDHTVIRKYALGYATWIAEDGGHLATTLGDCIVRAHTSVEKEAVIDAIATAAGTTFTGARQQHEEIRTVRAVAQERAERRGSTVAEEAVEVARERHIAREADRHREVERKERHTLRYIELEGHVAGAMRRLRAALDMAADVPFTDEERELIADSIAQLRAVLNLIDSRVTGNVDVDWDTELRKLGATS